MNRKLINLRNAACLSLGISAMAVGAAAQATLMTTLEDFSNGGGFFGEVILEDEGVDSVRVTANIQDPINVDLTKGDILGLWFNVNDFSLLGPLSTSQGNPMGIVNNLVVDEDNVTDLGGNVNLNGGGPNNPYPFDIGVVLGANGGAQGFVQTLSFLFTGSGLSEASFANQSVGMRVQSIEGGAFDSIGSSKLVGSSTPPPPTPVPAPGSLALLGIGLVGFGFVRRRYLG